MSIVRRIRALLMTAILWGGAWALTGALLVVGLWVLGGHNPPAVIAFWEQLAFQVVLWAAWGALSGTVFAVLLMGAERRRTLDELSPVRTALWGALGGMTLPLVTYAVLLLPQGASLRGLMGIGAVVLASGALGATIAGVTLALARRLPSGRSDRAQLGESAT